MTKIKLKTNKTKKSRLYSLLKYVKLRISKGGFEPPTLLILNFTYFSRLYSLLFFVLFVFNFIFVISLPPVFV